MDKQNTNKQIVKSAIYQRKFIIIFVFLVIITAGAVFVKIYKPPQKQPVIVKKTVIKQVVVKRSKDTGVINRALTGKVIDVNTGKILVAARVFSTNDKTVYLELDFNKAPKGTIIDYIRYKGGRYVDHGEVKLTKDNTENILFNWTINNLLGSVRDGQWRVATYTNGILAKRINYEIKNNKVSYVYPDESINSTDPDYKLSDVVASRLKTH